MATTFKVGDVVELKSGGPAMTVTVVTTGGPLGDLINTTWFSGAKKETGHFPPDSLREPLSPIA